MDRFSKPLVLFGLVVILVACKDPVLEHANEFLQLEDWPRAISLYDRSVQEHPKLAEARMGLALARAGLERDAAAVALDSAPHWLSVAHDFAIVERIDTTLSTADDRADALFRAALCWQRDGRIPQAQQAAAEAQAAYPNHAPSAQLLGSLARSHGDTAGAERWFLRAIAADSTFLPAWASLGELALAEGDPEGAILHWESALHLSPKHPWFLSMVRHVRDSLGLPAL